jgi:hypothetical protein
MPLRTEKDLWVEMSIREIWTQGHFAEIAYSNIDPKAEHGNDAVFSSIHSFLSHGVMISKMLSAKYEKTATATIGDVLGIDNSSPIHERKFRNHLEHYDERLADWIRKHGVNIVVGDFNIGSKSAIQIPNIVYIRHYDPTTSMFTFVNDDFNLRTLSIEINRIMIIADNWVKGLESHIINPPFIQ